jgi:hypothetical protein
LAITRALAISRCRDLAHASGGRPRDALQLKVELNPAITDQSFDVAADGYARVAALPDTLDEKIEKLGDGLFVIQNVAGQNQNTLAVEFEDYIVAVEAPGSSAGADEVIKRIKTAIPASRSATSR